MAVVDRRTLYERVWTVATTRLALEYGISDVGLAKVCRRYRIPRPPRGYWGKIQNGQKIRRPALPKITDPKLQCVFFHGANMVSGNPNPEAQAPLLVPPILADPHHLVARAQEQLAASAAGLDGLVKTDPRSAVDVRVRPVTVDRALRVWDTFAKSWEREGGVVVTATYGQSPCTAVSVGDDLLAIRMAETIEPVRRGQRSVGGPGSARPRLCFVLGMGRLDGIKQTWADTTTVPLEKMLRPLGKAIRLYLEVQRIRRLDRECEGRQQERINEIRKIKAQEIATHYYRRQELMQETERWHQSQKIRNYLAAMQAAVEGGELAVRDGDRFREWMQWAQSFAASLDPLVGTAPLDRPPLVTARNTLTEQLDLTSAARTVVSQLGVKDSDELSRVPAEKIRELAGTAGAVWNEITVVLEGLGYDVSKREARYY